MSDQIEVLWLIKGLGAGGAEQLLLTQARLRSQGIRPTVAITRPDRSHLRSAFEAEGIEVIELKGRSGHPGKVASSLNRLLRERHFDLIHSHSPALAPIGRLLGRLNSVPTMYTEHNRWARYRVSTRLANALTFGLDRHCFAVSEGVRQTIARPMRRHAEVLHHGTDLGRDRSPDERRSVRRALGLGDEDTALLVVANLRKQKAPVDFVKAVQLIDRSHAARFFWVGQGPLEEEFTNAIARYEVGDRLTFLGYREDVRSLMAAADVFCLSSVHEGLPVAVMEAMAEGLPIIATSVGGLPEVVQTSDPCGILTPPSRPDLLAESIESMLTRPALRLELGASALRAASRFDARRAVAHIEQVYRAIA